MTLRVKIINRDPCDEGLLGGRVENLAEGRVDMNHVVELRESRVLADEDTRLLDKVGGMSTEGMAADDALRARLDDEFQQTLCLVHSQRLTIGAVESLATFVADAVLLTVVLAHADTGSLGSGEDSRGHNIEAYAVRDAEDMVDSTEALHRGGMGEHATAVDIAYGVDIADRRQHIVIDDDTRLAILYADSLKVQSLGVGGTSGGNEHHVSVDRLGLVLL